MLQSMRDGAQSTAAKIIIGLIVLSFAGFGLESLLPGGSGTSVAEVNGEEISPVALQQAINAQKQQLAQVFGEQIDPAMLDDDRLRPGALDGLIQRILVLQEANELGLTASQREIGRAITAMATFQVDGRFDADQYRRVLATAGYTPERFRRAQADDMILQQLQRSLVETEFVTPLEASAAANVGAEARDVRYIEIPADTLVTAEATSDEQITSYYDANEEQFMEPLRLVAEYLLLSVEDYIEPVSEELLREEFEAVRDDYVVKEQARVAHILLTPGGSESEAEFQQRVSDVEVRLASDDADFADLAAEYSDDIGSASLGGELGFTEGDAFPPAMEEAIAALEAGQISAPVETDAGTHFILLQERVAGEAPDFEALRPELEYAIQTAEAQRQLLLDADTVRDLAFNAADLGPAGEAINASIMTSEPFSAFEGEGIFANDLLRTAAFSDEVLVGGNNSELIELSEGTFVLLRVAKEIAPARQPLEQVTDEIVATLTVEAEQAALAELLDQVNQRLVTGDSLEAIAKDLEYRWQVELGATRVGSQLPRPVLDTAFSMSSDDVESLRSVGLPEGGFALVQLARITAGSLTAMPEAQQQILTRQTASEYQRSTLTEFVGVLRADADIVTR